MLKNRNRARWAVSGSLVAFALAVPSGCSSFKDQLLEPQNPGLIDESAVGSPAAAAALKNGALNRLKRIYTVSETTWQEAGHLADEFQNADFQPSRNDVDQRTMASSSPDYGNYQDMTQNRGFIRDAIKAEMEFEPTKTADIGELWMWLGFTE